MRTVGLLLVVGVFLALNGAVVGAQCTLFSIDVPCQSPPRPRLNVDFGPGPKPASPSIPPQRVQRLQTRPADAGHAPAAIDCQMVRHADPTIDPLFVKRAPAGVKYSMRVIDVPACAVK